MVAIEEFDQFGQYSNLELHHKLGQHKFSNINNFIEDSLNKIYNIYKKNKKSNITFMDYRNLMLKEFEKRNNRENYKPPLPSKISNSKADVSFIIFEEEESSLSI